MVVYPDIAPLLDSWLLHLAAERKSAQTLKTYGDGVRAFLRWCEAADRTPVLDRPTVNAFVAALLDEGAEASTARSRQLAVRRFSAWLAEEGEIDTAQLVNLKPPKLDHKVVPELDDDQLRALIKACKGNDLRDRRDEAIVRFMVETGARAGEIVGMSVADIDLKRGAAVVRRGKGGKGRTVPVGPQAARALDRYIRARRTHRLAQTPALWLGDRGKGFSYDGLYVALRYRADLAGEEFFILDVTDRPNPLPPDLGDFWIFDSAMAALMRYSPDGQFLGADVLPDERGPEFVAHRDTALAHAEPFEDWWAKPAE